jgi:serpin B
VKQSWTRALTALTMLALAAPLSARPNFSEQLYGALPQHGNLFCSPYSIVTALRMVEAGARGETARQMHAVLGDSQSVRLPASSEFELSTVNRIWTEKGEAFLPAYLEEIRSKFGADVQSEDFAHAAEVARQTINGWVSKATHGKITDLLPPRAVNSSTRMVLTNAIYFKGKWVAGFPKGATAKEAFHTPNGSVQTDFMHQTGHFSGFFGPDLQVLQLPYKGNRLSMVLVQSPQVGAPVPALASSWPKALLRVKVAVDLPKFTLTESYSLNQVLEKLGMTALFRSGADLSGMNGKRDLFVSLVQHKAFVDVDEEGTVAAAATGVVATRSIRMAEKLEHFRADHPFLFLIQDNQTGEILFMGRVEDPRG